MKQEQNTTQQIIELLSTILEGGEMLYQSSIKGDSLLIEQLTQDMLLALNCILETVKVKKSYAQAAFKKFERGILSIIGSLKRLELLYNNDQEYCLKKIQYEFIPLVEGVYHQVVFWGFHEADEKGGLSLKGKDTPYLCWGNSYIDQSIKTGNYLYEVSIVIMAYNKLDYTKLCLENLLKNIPKGLNYELILLNHGSTDGTEAYFKSIHPTKQLDIAVNGGGANAVGRIIEGEFAIFISNDVIITPNCIENLLTLIRSDSKIAWAVPTTSNISNLQTIDVQYNSSIEMQDFAVKNNVSDCFRWEQRARLCNPLDIRRSSAFYSSQGIFMDPRFYATYMMSFMDDEISLLLRRSGYKMILAKDSYCHHFGSVTLKNEIQPNFEQEHYINGRKMFLSLFQVDPWGTGFCYTIAFTKRVIKEEKGHVDILGINCGFGSNSLKIKEQIKEYCHNTDVTLVNITDCPAFLEDLQGVSDSAWEITNIEQFEEFLMDKRFDYIVWEDVFLQPNQIKEIYKRCMNSLSIQGRFFMRINPRPLWLKNSNVNIIMLEDNWICIQKKGK